MPQQVKRFIYVPRDDLCNAGSAGAVEVYETKNASFPKLVGAYYDIEHRDLKRVGIHRKHAIKILEEHEKIRTTKKGRISSKNIDLRCLGD